MKPPKSSMLPPAEQPDQRPTLRRGINEMRLETAKDQFVAYKRDGGPNQKRCQPNTLRTYNQALRKFIDWLAVTTGSHSVLKFNAERVREYLDHRSSQRNLSMNTLSTDSMVLREFADWGAQKRNRYWLREDVEDIPRIRKPKMLPRPYAADERDRLMRLPLDHPQERLLRALLYYAGLRESEAISLRLRDIRPPHVLPTGEDVDGSMYVRGKGAKERVISIPPPLWTVLAEHLKALRGVPLDRTLLAKRSGEPWSAAMVQKRVRRWGKAAGVDRPKAHRFRHAQPMSSPVLTPSGWKTMGNLKPGDVVIGADGLPTEVTGIYPQGAQPVVRLLFSDGATVECTFDHLWVTRAPLSRQWPRTGTFALRSTREIVESGSKWLVPVTAPVRFHNDALLPMDPYTLGALLGDGYFGDQLVLATTQPEIRQRIASALPPGYALHGANGRYALVTLGTRRENKLLRAVKSLGLSSVRSAEKSIPSAYFTASMTDRIELLRGLMDTDGFARSAGGTAEFATVSSTLAIGIIELARSLGGTARARTEIPYRGAKHRVHRISIRTPFCPFHLARKRMRYQSLGQMPFFRTIIGSELVGVRDCLCIQVANADGLYVTQDYVLTHNTFATDNLDSDTDIRTIQELLGHASLATTEIYTRVSDKRKAAALRRLPDFTSPAETIRLDYATPERAASEPPANPA